MEGSPEMFVHTVPETGRLLPSASRWNSIEIDFGLVPASVHPGDDTHSNYSKSVEFSLSISDKTHFRRFIYITIALFLLAIATAFLVALLPHKRGVQGSSVDLGLALNRALLFYDAQKSGVLPKSNPVKFRGNSGLRDGKEGQANVNLVGGFYDSGSNVKFSFTTAYTITLLSWSVIEYRQKYEAIGELDHVKDIIRWGSDYLMKVFVPSGSKKAALLYSQVGSVDVNANTSNDITCWQRPEDMTYPRPVSICGSSASDLAGEIIAALAAASLVFDQDDAYSKDLIRASESLFELATNNPHKQTYTAIEACGGEASNLYNSSSYYDEMVWGGTWLFFATGNFSYLHYATETFKLAVKDEAPADNGVFYWNNKLAANAVLLTRLWYLHDPGYPYDATLKLSSEMTSMFMCSYISQPGKFITSTGGLILLKPSNGASLQYAATAAFLSKIYSDYLNIIQITGSSCGGDYYYSVDVWEDFARSQVNYILGDNPSKMSYLVGFGDRFPQQVHHRAASIPWDGKHYTCAEGERWRNSEDPNPNVLVGAMVAGPDRDGKFLDERNWPVHTEPTIAANAGLVAALVALLDDQISSETGGMERNGIFENIAQIT